jgi:hypothetical protein
MADVQTTYSQNMPIGIVGQKVDGEEWNAITRVCETAAGIDFGRTVQRGAADGGCAIAGAAMTPAQFLGIAVRDVSIRPSAGNKYPQYGNVTILTQGAIWAKVGEAVAPGDAALFDTATGLYMKTAGAGRVALPNGWEFDTTAALNGLAILVRRKD